ncbi:MAG: AI-2E family transporter [Micropruina sp.]|uniref:AI-2E family transporter n=1 Tax=Micropruina sp. TaxID=2737536 RepID=UPI0039E6EA23
MKPPRKDALVALSMFRRQRRHSSVPARIAETPVVVVEPSAEPVENVIPQGVRTAAGWAWRALVFAALVWGIGWLLSEFSEVTVPLAIALLLTALLSPLVRRFKRWNWPPLLAAAGGLLAMGLVVVLIGWGIGSTAVRQAAALVDQTVAGFQALMQWLAGDPLHIDQTQIDQWMGSLTTWISDSRSLLAGYAAKVGTSVGHFFAGIAIATIATFFFLADGEHMWKGFVGILPQRYQESTDAAAHRGWASLVSYMRAQVIVSAVDAAGVAIIAAAIGVPMALALFALTFVVCFVPVVGAVIAGTVATSLALITHGWVAALIMLGGTIAVMWLESHLLQPLLLGRAASLHPLAVLIGIAVGATVGGIVGALVVIPVMAFGVAFIRHLRGVRDDDPERKRKH